VDVTAATWNTTSTCASEPKHKRRKTPHLGLLDNFEVVSNRRVAEGEHGEILNAAELERRSAYLNDKKVPQVRAMLKLVDGIVGAYERGSSHTGEYPDRTSDVLLVDVGCGRGDLVANLALAFPDSQVLGLDLNRVSLNHARDFARDLGLTNVQFLESKVEDLDWDELIDRPARFEDHGDHHHHHRSPRCGRIGPRWTYDPTVEKPRGKEDCGTYTIVVYTDEQQRRLGVDKFGKVSSPPPAPPAPPARRRRHHVILFGLHACGGLSDAIIDAAVRRGVAFCVCTCCFASNSGLRGETSYLAQHGSLVLNKKESDLCCRGLCSIPADASVDGAGEVDTFPLCTDMWLRIARMAETNEPTVAETARNAAICLNHLRLRAARTCLPYHTSLVELPKETTHRNHVVVGVPKKLHEENFLHNTL